MVKALGDSASELGGGHARHLAVRYLTQDVAPWLEGHFTEATGRDLFAATSQLVHLAGWMAQDEGDTPELRGLAQRYYAHSFRLAAEAGDPELSATALRGLACARSVSDRVAVRSAGVETRSLVSPLQLAGSAAA